MFFFNKEECGGSKTYYYQITDDDSIMGKPKYIQNTTKLLMEMCLNKII
jgi:hypothetical protein